VRGKNSPVVKRVRNLVTGSNVEKKRWKELNRLLDGMLVEHYAWGLVIDEPEPESERPIYDRGTAWSGVAQKLKNHLEPWKDPAGTAKRRGVYSLVAGTLLGKMRGGRLEPAKN
jgi:hypothetical protein